MGNSFEKVVKTKRPVIGMVHFPPLFGYEGFPGVEACLKKSIKDAEALAQGGVDAIMVENNYDIPHKEFVGPEVTAIMTYLTGEIAKKVKLPLGINVLWNDYKTALAVAKVCGAKFIRVPVFVDSVETSYGKIFARPADVLSFRKNLRGEDILLFTDIHVKHAKMIEEKTINQSALEAVRAGSDGLIVTGKWTGDAPNLDDLKEARAAVGGDFPILVGSGADKDNVVNLLKFADGVIVATSLKTGKVSSKETNLKPWEEGICLSKTKEFVSAFRRGIKKR